MLHIQWCLAVGVTKVWLEIQIKQSLWSVMSHNAVKAGREHMGGREKKA